MRGILIGLLAAAGLAITAPAAAQTQTANYTWTNPTDQATQIKVEYGSGSGCTATGCSTYAAAPGSPIAATATQFSQSGFVVGTPMCHRFTRTGGGAADGDPVVACGTPQPLGKNGQIQNLILIFSPSTGTTRSAPPAKTPAAPK